MSVPLNLTIRFSISISDLPLTIPSATTTFPPFLKQQIRLLRPQTSSKRLRLFHQGKPLRDDVPIAEALRSVLPPAALLPPPPRTRSHGIAADVKGKGKATEEAPPPQQEQPPIFLLCSIGPTLTPSDLTTEQQQQQRQEQQQQTPTSPPHPTSTTPLGFDGLLSSGLTPAEIAQLRAQFEALQSYAHTPDTMPSAAQMRVLEDRWLNESVGPGAEDGGGVGGGGAGGGSYEDMLLGTVVGFFWPLGAVVWLLREEGVWSKRRQMAVVAGMLVNIAFSVLRNTS
jgi:DUF2407 C-terminal domain/DUF2407 ubiquitin-like domain